MKITNHKSNAIKKSSLKDISKESPIALHELEDLARKSNLSKKFNEAILYCETAMNTNSELFWPHLIKSYSLYFLKNIEESKKEAKIALDLDDKSWETNFWWGSCLCFFDKNLSEGIKFLEKAAEIENNNWYLFKNLSSAYARYHNPKKYYEAIRQMNRIKPSKSLSLIQKFESKGFAMAVLIIIYSIYFLLLIIPIIVDNKFLLWIPAILISLLIIISVMTIQTHRVAGIIFMLANIIIGLSIPIILLLFNS